MTTPQKTKQDLLRAIPKVDEFLTWVTTLETMNSEPKPPRRLVLQAIRQTLEDKRQQILKDDLPPESLEKDALVKEFSERLKEKMTPNFRSVINATGVVIHTNLGRSVLPASTMQGLIDAGLGYSNLELDLATGKRGSRYSLVEELLCELTGAEAALVVNNNAAAVLLVLESLAKDKEVIVSRGQLVEIGGSFRIPDVMAKSGARLVEVGATNRTHVRDYENAITEETALLLKVHTSNYRMIGFTSEVAMEEMVEIGKRHDLPVVEDLGSGSLIDLSLFGLEKEPTVGQVIKAGVDVVTFSGDKLLGGPQAGLILGSRQLIDKIKKNPMNRALRIDKFTLAALESILRLYFDEDEAIATIPTLAMLAMPLDELEKRARRLLRRLRRKLNGKCEVGLQRTDSMVGGGALPEQSLPTWSVALTPGDRSAASLEKAMRRAEHPVLGRIENNIYLLDMRTVADKEISRLADSLFTVFEVTD